MPGWKGNLKFGCGAQRGAGLTGFHPGQTLEVFSGLLFRGDSRPPTKWIGTGLFKGGFELHQAGVNVAGRVTASTAQVHCDHGTTRGVVSASKDVKIGCYWACHAAQAHGDTHAWVYAIYIENEPLAADAVWNLQGEQGQGAAVVQAEIMLKSIPGSRIFAARKAAVAGGHGARQNCLLDTVVYNTGYTGTDFRTLGAAAIDPNWALFTNGGNPVPCQ